MVSNKNRATRKRKMFAAWDAHKKRLLRLESKDASTAAIRKSFSVEFRDHKLFSEWVDKVLDAEIFVEVTEESRRTTAFHEAGHAVVAELLDQGSVLFADCYHEIRDDARGYFERIGWAPGAMPLQTAHEIAILLAGGFFEAKLGGNTAKKIHAGAAEDRRQMDEHFEACCVAERDRGRYMRFPNNVLNRLASSGSVCRAVRTVADILVRDEHISGDRVREIIATEIGSIVKLLSSLGIPRVELEPSAKVA
jgi:hypothetical protein